MRPRKSHSAKWIRHSTVSGVTAITLCGREIDGYGLPFWEATCKTCIRAAEANGYDTTAEPAVSLRTLEFAPAGSSIFRPIGRIISSIIDILPIRGS